MIQWGMLRHTRFVFYPPSAFLFHPLPPPIILLAVLFFSLLSSLLCFPLHINKATAVLIIPTFVQRLLFLVDQIPVFRFIRPLLLFFRYLL